MARVLILFAHPALQKSRVNVELVKAVHDLPGVTFHDLCERYPDCHINVYAEQKLLTQHDIVVFQHPVYGYSCPSILKEWLDLVLEWGFAYGENGTALRGKRLLSAITAGGPAEAYDRSGFNYFTVRELLAPFEQTARLCGMEYLTPHVLHAVQRMTQEEIATAASNYRQLITSLRDGSRSSLLRPALDSGSDFDPITLP